jgi:seryl-tRNA synthetase
MFDLQILRTNPELFDKSQKKRGEKPFTQEALAIDSIHRKVLTDLQELQAERHQIAKKFGLAKKNNEDTTELSKRSEEIKYKLNLLEEEAKHHHEQLIKLLSEKPNMPLDDVPVGSSEADNVCIRTVGAPRQFNYMPQAHYDLGEKLNMMDFEQASHVAGSRFVYLKADLARLERALAAFMLDNNTQDFGYTEVSTPVIMNERAFYGTAQLPKFHDDQFQTTDGRWLIPSAEVSLTNLVNGQILQESDLPLRYTAYTPCFRKEAGSAGRDTRGMIRQHQFNKVEMVSITTQEDSAQELERMTNVAETLLQKLGLPYKVVVLCTGDMGFSAQKTYDIEVWLPSQKTYREISSCSTCGDFQARRMNARYKKEGEKKLQFLHTLNGSGLPVGRTMVAILENYQNEDGSINVPDVLHPYMNNQKIIQKQ